MPCCVYVDNLEDHRCISLVPWLPDVLDPHRNCLTFSVSDRGPLDRCTNTPPLQYPRTARFAMIGAEFGLNLHVKNVTLGPLGQPVRNVTGGWLRSDILSFRSAGVRTFLFVLLDGFTPHLALDWFGRWPRQMRTPKQPQSRLSPQQFKTVVTIEHVIDILMPNS